MDLFFDVSKANRRKRIYVSRKRYDKIDKYAKEEGLMSGGHIIDEMMEKFIEENNL